MDLVLDFFDRHFLDSVYASFFPLSAGNGHPYASYAPTNSTSFEKVSSWPRESPSRQLLSLHVITAIGTLALYFGIASLSYRCIFDHRMMKHPRFLKNQVRMEIMLSLKGFPWLVLMTVPWFILEVRGQSQTYASVADGPWGQSWLGYAYIPISGAWFLLFTDYLIYWIHRVLHWPWLYKRLHKPHHKWIIPTPFASHAFHPLDGYAQSLPYHIFPFLFPVHRVWFLILFVGVNLWSVFIHDSEMLTDNPLEEYINGPSHHTLHHMYFVCNYGQYFTTCDKLYGSYRSPDKGEDPLIAVLAAEERRKENKDAALGAGDEKEVRRRKGTKAEEI